MIGALLLVVGTFLVTAPWGDRFIALLQRLGVGKQIRVDGPTSHEVKRGTPTMGGILFLAPVLIVGGALAVGRPRLWAPIAVTAVFAALGAVDDIRGLRDVKGVGWLARFKFPWQVLLSLVSAVVLYYAGAPRWVSLPFVQSPFYIGLGFIPLAAFVILCTVNAVNFTDGLDGLAGGTTAMAFAAYGLITLTAMGADTSVALLCAVFVGGILAFLWFNTYPARVFMGDIGSLGLGAGLASVALMTEHWVLLPLVGAIFVAEVVSVVLQIAYFKYTHGRRLFRMAPLHHHLELTGWAETQITFRFWLVGAALAMAGVALAVMR
jgi:phospho-N-acetylmuramoyl-pentapeptide-transferase